MSCKLAITRFVLMTIRPSYNRRSMLSSLSDTSTYLYWPSPFFDSEFIFQDRSSSTDREWVEITKQKQKEEIKSRESKLIQQYGSFFMKKKGNSYSPLTWRIGVKSNCYVGVCCTEETIIDNSPDQNAEYQVHYL